MLSEGAIAESELEGDHWPNEDAKEYAAHLYRECLASRRRTVREVGGAFVCKRRARSFLRQPNAAAA